MNFREYLSCAVKKTTGTVDGINLNGGIVVGYTYRRKDEQLVVRLNHMDGYAGIAFKLNIIKKDEKEKYISKTYTYCLCSPSNVIMEESKQHDLTEILKGCNGVKLWSDICGDCTLIKIDHDDEYPLTVQTETINGEEEISFCKDGRYVRLFPYGKCTLWPSKTLRDWSRFEKPKNPNIPKEGELVACFDTQWHNPLILRYKSGNMCYEPKDSTQNKAPEAFAWKYIIPLKDYNPDLSEKELKALSIV